MKFEVSILVILEVRFGIPHVFVFSKSVYLTAWASHASDELLEGCQGRGGKEGIEKQVLMREAFMTI